MAEITQVLDAIERGDPKAAEALLPLVYQELRHLAANKMSGQPAGHTLQPTALVHEAWLRLAGDGGAKFCGRTHFFAASAEAMRQILIDSARRKQAARRGGGLARVDLGEIEVAAFEKDDEALAVHEALEKLARENAKKAELVKLRYFAGMTFEEAAEVMGISVATAKRYWVYARAWLYDAIAASQRGGQPQNIRKP